MHNRNGEVKAKVKEKNENKHTHTNRIETELNDLIRLLVTNRMQNYAQIAVGI